ncbi:MAG TPA: ABC transporter ATP-binding protein [Solirubrobacterales bacterium]|nr:ABC transporter ATP-binding protein [Solirubrobacterales bacterium]
MENAISVKGLRKSYGTVAAVRGIDLEVPHGEIFAFLGPNGAGKTTTVEILEGFQAADAGAVSVLGADPARAPRGWRERVGIVLQESPGEIELTVRECLEFYAGLYAAPRGVEETLARVGLGGAEGQKAMQLSGGQRRRLDVALALIGDPELLFLDEPTTGFDPAARREAWEMLAGLRALGKTIFLTTHYMEEAERLADRIAVIAGGEIVDVGTPRTIGNRDRADTEISFTLPAGLRPRDLPADLLALLAGPADGREVLLRSVAPLPDLQRLGTWLDGRGAEIADLEVHRPSLEEVYLDLTAASNGAAANGRERA